MIKPEFKSHNQNLIRERQVPLIMNHLLSCVFIFYWRQLKLPNKKRKVLKGKEFNVIKKITLIFLVKLLFLSTRLPMCCSNVTNHHSTRKCRHKANTVPLSHLDSPTFFSPIFIQVVFTLDLPCWIEGPIRSSRMLTLPIRQCTALIRCVVYKNRSKPWCLKTTGLDKLNKFW